MAYDDFKKADIGSASLLLHHVTTSHILNSRSSDTPKKTILLIYLLRYRYIFRYQIFTLLSYSKDTLRGANEFINRLSRSGLVKKVSAGETSFYDCFSITTAGMDSAALLFKTEVSSLLQENLSFAKKCASLLSESSCSLDECIENLRSQCGKKRKNLTAHTHLIATEDSYITLLRLLSPDQLLNVQYEVTYSNGLPISQREQLLNTRYRSTDIRSDSVLTHSLPLPEGRANEAGTPTSIPTVLRTIVEQDTTSQHSAIITDKLNRYRDNIITQWLSTNEAPPLLLFSLLTSHQGSGSKEEGKYSTKGIYYSTGIALLGEVLSVERSALPATITLGVVEQYLASLPSNATTSKDYLSFIREQIRKFGASLPAAELRTRYTSNKDKRAAEGNENYSRYISRRLTIFNSAERSTGWLPLFLRGVSLATIPNSQASALLALYPAYCAFERIIERLPSVSVSGHGTHIKAFTPFKTVSIGTQTVTLRSCYTSTEDSIYAVENVSDDYGGYMRVLTLLNSNTPLPCTLILLIRVDDIENVLPRIQAAAGQRENEVYICHYSISSECEIPVFNTPIRLSRI